MICIFKKKKMIEDDRYIYFFNYFLLRKFFNIGNKFKKKQDLMNIINEYFNCNNFCHKNIYVYMITYNRKQFSNNYSWDIVFFN